ncbi:hypothetical protein PV04_02118 [Phialophora macrospora]|uniref:Uncharacterized protein n=1 Tax=Phialophora macrospora TaxID=1851006 RepID=A0A0D2G5N1_9EURO|nr:hypothetical protein PV04_02118 [Phialophora macrospora]
MWNWLFFLPRISISWSQASPAVASRPVGHDVHRPSEQSSTVNVNSPETPCPPGPASADPQMLNTPASDDPHLAETPASKARQSSKARPSNRPPSSKPPAAEPEMSTEMAGWSVEDVKKFQFCAEHALRRVKRRVKTEYQTPLALQKDVNSLLETCNQKWNWPIIGGRPRNRIKRLVCRAVARDLHSHHGVSILSLDGPSRLATGPSPPTTDPTAHEGDIPDDVFSEAEGRGLPPAGPVGRAGGDASRPGAPVRSVKIFQRFEPFLSPYRHVLGRRFGYRALFKFSSSILEITVLAGLVEARSVIQFSGVADDDVPGTEAWRRVCNGTFGEATVVKGPRSPRFLRPDGAQQLMAFLGVLQQLQPVLTLARNMRKFVREDAFKCICSDSETNDYNHISQHMRWEHNVPEFVICMCGMASRPQDHASHAAVCQVIAEFRRL